MLRQLKKLWNSGSLAWKVIPLADDQRERGQHQADAEERRRSRVKIQRK